MINVIKASHEITSPRFAAAFARGCKGRVVENYQGGVWAGFGSPQNWDSLFLAIRSGNEFYYGDHAYFGRGKYYRITKNALQHSGFGNGSLERLKPFYEEARPWVRGSKVIVCAQSQPYHDRTGENDWLDRTLKKLSLATDREIVIRRKNDHRPLQLDLDDAWCVVTQSSAAAIHGLMLGVPAICTSQCAASCMSLSDVLMVEKPYYPDDRMEWAAVLANNQWTLEEIKLGKAWRALNEKI